MTKLETLLIKKPIEWGGYRYATMTLIQEQVFLRAVLYPKARQLNVYVTTRPDALRPRIRIEAEKVADLDGWV